MRKLPKEIKGFHFPKLFAVDMNEFEPEMILPGLFFLIRTRGRERGGRTDATEIMTYARRFCEHEHVEGFAGDVGLRLAHKWSRTSFASVGRRGRAGKEGEQLTYLVPLSFLTYKPAFPSQGTRHRNVHRFLYDLMFRTAGMSAAWADTGVGRATTEPPLSAMIRLAFSRGVTLSAGSDNEARYDGKTQVDTEILASMYYADGFRAVQPAARPVDPPPAPAIPGAAQALARDILCFVTAYAPRMPTLALARSLTALLAIELAAYTLRLVTATNQLVQEGYPPADFSANTTVDAAHLGLYCDLTEDRRSVSAQIAGQCVARDLESFEHFLRSALTLRTLNRFVETIAKLRTRFPEREGPEYLKALLDLRDDAYAEIAAAQELQAIRSAWASSEDEGVDGTEPQQFEGTYASDLDHLIDVLAKTQRRGALGNCNKWYWNICGLEKEYGILTGSSRQRTTWRYGLSHSLLETLVQLCVVLPEYRPFEGMRAGRSLEQQLEPMPVLLSDFLRFLRERFGILVDRPPQFRQDAEALQAAKTNLVAFKERLRQMGLFQDLSDDFNAQCIYPRFKERIRDFEEEEATASLRGEVE